MEITRFPSQFRSARRLGINVIVRRHSLAYLQQLLCARGQVAIAGVAFETHPLPRVNRQTPLLTIAVWKFSVASLVKLLVVVALFTAPCGLSVYVAALGIT